MESAIMPAHYQTFQDTAANVAVLAIPFTTPNADSAKRAHFSQRHPRPGRWPDRRPGGGHQWHVPLPGAVHLGGHGRGPGGHRPRRPGSERQHPDTDQGRWPGRDSRLELHRPLQVLSRTPGHQASPGRPRLRGGRYALRPVHRPVVPVPERVESKLAGVEPVAPRLRSRRPARRSAPNRPQLLLGAPARHRKPISSTTWACPLRACKTGQSGVVPGSDAAPRWPSTWRSRAQVRPMITRPTFQAGHASSILVTRSTTCSPSQKGFRRCCSTSKQIPRFHLPPTPRATSPPARARSEVERGGYLAVPLAGRVLVDQRRAHAAVAHSVISQVSAVGRRLFLGEDGGESRASLGTGLGELRTP